VGRVSPARRERLRERARQERASWLRDTAAVKQAGGTCRTCQHAAKTNVGSKRYCTLDSGFDGFAMVRSDHACPRFVGSGRNLADATSNHTEESKGR
jgi:hypothetical protein